jgi:hypothetical protein
VRSPDEQRVTEAWLAMKSYFKKVYVTSVLTKSIPYPFWITGGELRSHYGGSVAALRFVNTGQLFDYWNCHRTGLKDCSWQHIRKTTGQTHTKSPVSLSTMTLCLHVAYVIRDLFTFLIVRDAGTSRNGNS